MLKILGFYFGMEYRVWTMDRGWHKKKGYLMEYLDLQCYGASKKRKDSPIIVG